MPRQHITRLQWLQKHPAFSELDYKHQVFLAVLEEFLQGWPDHDVVNHFQVVYKLSQKLDVLGTGDEHSFIFKHKTVTVAVQNVETSAKTNADPSTTILYCFCHAGDHLCQLGFCPCSC